MSLLFRDTNSINNITTHQ